MPQHRRRGIGGLKQPDELAAGRSVVGGAGSSEAIARGRGGDWAYTRLSVSVVQ